MLMNWRNSVRFCGITAVAVAAFVVAQPVSAQSIERNLAGIRLNSTFKTVLIKYGNPDEVIVGEVGVRTPPTGGRVGGGAPGGFGGYPGGGIGGGADPEGAGPGLPSVGGGKGGRLGGGALGGGGFAPPGLGGTGGFPGGYPGGAPGGFGGGKGGQDEGGAPAFGGGYPGGAGFGGGGANSFAPGVGRTLSTLTRQQEVTWIYNRKVKNKKGEDEIVSYEFLIGPNGNVSQIRVIGYIGGNSRTQRGVVLGSTYKDLQSIYGFPESHTNLANGLLVVSYRQKYHVEFQLIANRNATTYDLNGYKVIGITIATVE